MDGEGTRWIDEEFLKLALINGGKDEFLTISNFTIKPAVESGNNYCTQLYRVKLNYQRGNDNHSKSLIIKAPLDEGSLAKPIIDEIGLLKTEYIMYKEILPEIYAISKHQFGPKCYFCKRDDVLVMDDLTEDGYVMCDRLQQLDVNHCRTFIVTLAKYHATTVALHKKNPNLVEANGTHPMYNGTTELKMITYHETMKRNAFLTILQKLNGMEDLIETIQTHGDNLRDALVKVFIDGGSVNVLNHGDCWNNNIMFKYTESGEIFDCKLIDFQIRSYGTPAVDLLYFLFSSAKNEVRRDHMEELLQLYCDILNEKLSGYNCKERLSFENLQQEVKNSSPWALHIVINYLPMILNEPDELSEKLKENSENLKSFDINVNPVLRTLLGKTYNAVLPEVCKDLLALGLVDYFKHFNS